MAVGTISIVYKLELIDYEKHAGNKNDRKVGVCVLAGLMACADGSERGKRLHHFIARQGVWSSTLYRLERRKEIGMYVCLVGFRRQEKEESMARLQARATMYSLQRREEGKGQLQVATKELEG